jgi:hypothetical protein
LTQESGWSDGEASDHLDEEEFDNETGALSNVPGTAMMQVMLNNDLWRYIKSFQFEPQDVVVARKLHASLMAVLVFDMSYNLSRRVYSYSYNTHDQPDVLVVKFALVVQYRFFFFRHVRHNASHGVNGTDTTLLRSMHPNISQINGNNGEWTNGDDLAATLSTERQRREYANITLKKNNMVDKPTYLPREVKKKPIMCKHGAVETCPFGVRCKYTHAVSPQASKSNTEITDSNDEDDESYDGEVLFDAIEEDKTPMRKRTYCRQLIDDQYYVCVAGNITNKYQLLDIASEGDMMYNVVASGPGWVEREFIGGRLNRAKGADCVLEPFYAVMSVDPFEYQQVCMGLTNYEVYIPLLQTLRKDFPLSHMNAQAMNAIEAFALKQVRGNSVRYIKSTCEYFMNHSLHRITKTQSSTVYGKMMNNSEIVGLGIAAANQVLISNRLPVHLDSARQEPWQIPDETGDNLPILFYKMRDDFNLRVDKIDMDETGKKRILFDNLGNTRTSYRTAFFSFDGLGQNPFIRYANTPINVCNATARFFKAREDEEEMRANQFWLWRTIKHYCEEDVSTHSIVADGERVDDISMTLGGRAYDVTLIRNVVDPAYHWVARQIKDVLDNFDYGLIARAIDALKNNGRWAYLKAYQALTLFQDMFTARTEVSKVEHVRKLLRMMYVNNQLCHDTRNIMVRELDVLLKDEIAKFGKVGRLYTAYGAGAMYANELPEYVKVLQNGLRYFTHNGCHLYMRVLSKFEDDAVTTCFTELMEHMNEPNTMYMACYGDDQIYGSTIGDRQFANVDISSNDSNQDICTLGVMGLAMSRLNHEWGLGLLRQCKLPMAIRNPNKVARDERIELKFNGPFMGSGTVLTTPTNNFGSMMIGLSTFFELAEGRNDSNFDICVREGAKRVGHTVTCEIGEVWEDLQFLKFSPVLCTDGKYHAMRNIGPIIRNLGKVNGDLLSTQLGVTHVEFSRMSSSERMDKFFGTTVAGYVNEPSHATLQALRERFPHSNSSQERGLVNYDALFDLPQDMAGCRGHLVALEESVARRYKCTVADLHDFAQLIVGLKLGQTVALEVIAMIYTKDYGVVNAPEVLIV